MKAEVAAAEGRGKAEAEKAALQAALDTALAQAQAQQASLLLNTQRLETDAKDYKVSSSPLHHHMRRFCTVKHAMPLSTQVAIRCSCSVGITCNLNGVSYARRMIMALHTPHHPTSDRLGPFSSMFLMDGVVSMSLLITYTEDMDSAMLPSCMCASCRLLSCSVVPYHLIMSVNAWHLALACKQQAQYQPSGL